MYQKLIIIGNLGRDPEMRYTPDGKAVTTFSVATSRKYNEKEETTWFRVSVWGKKAKALTFIVLPTDGPPEIRRLFMKKA